MRVVLLTAGLLLALRVPAVGLGQDQLYTGDAATVEPGHTQFQLYYNTTYKAGAKLGGTSFTFGATGNSDVKLSYGYLWNYRGADVQLGPSLGAKWRFAGNGQTNPSASISCLYALNEGRSGRTRTNDLGGMLIVQYPTRCVTFLGNLGRVWVGDQGPDARYLALAAGKFVTPHVLLAAQYIELGDLGGGPASRELKSYVGAIVYRASRGSGYSLQIGYSPGVQRAHWNTTIGFSEYF